MVVGLSAEGGVVRSVETSARLALISRRRNRNHISLTRLVFRSHSGASHGTAWPPALRSAPLGSALLRSALALPVHRLVVFVLVGGDGRLEASGRGGRWSPQLQGDVDLLGRVEDLQQGEGHAR